MAVQASSPTTPVGVPILVDNTLRHALPAGSRVLTSRGEAAIETLVPGDRVITRDHGMALVHDVIHTRVSPGTPMVMVPANAMGAARPERDIALPPDQPLVLRDWRARTIFGAHEARVAVARLVDGSVIRFTRTKGCEVYSLVLDRPSALYVDGLEIVSGSRSAMEPAP